MIEGWFEKLHHSARAPHAHVIITVINPRNPEKRHSAKLMVDTGFTGEMSLPRELIDNLDLDHQGWRYPQSFDGNRQKVETFKGSASWFGTDIEVEVEEIKADHPVLFTGLLGMELLSRAKLTMDPVRELVCLEPVE